MNDVTSVDRSSGALLRVLVTGASGFIGRALVPALVMRGHRVRAAARQTSVGSSAVESVVLSDVAQPVDWAPLLNDIDVVVHLAGIAHRRGAATADYDQANRGATADLARCCKSAGVKRLIFMSSIGAQSGSASDHPLTETDSPQPVTDYDRAKLAAEEAVREAGVAYTILRPVIIYGPDPKGNVAALVRAAKSPMPLPFGAFHNRRSLLARDNLIAAVELCLQSGSTRNQTFLVADPDPLSLAQMLTVLRSAQGRRPGLLPVPPEIFRVLFKLSGRSMMWDRLGRDLVVDPKKLLAAGWRPPVTTADGLRAMMRDDKLSA